MEFGQSQQLSVAEFVGASDRWEGFLEEVDLEGPVEGLTCILCAQWLAPSELLKGVI